MLAIHLPQPLLQLIRLPNLPQQRVQYNQIRKRVCILRVCGNGLL